MGVVAAVAALRAHLQVVGVQERACAALAYVCYGTDAAAPARKQRALTAGALEAVVAAVQAHPGAADVQRLAGLGCWRSTIFANERKTVPGGGSGCLQSPRRIEHVVRFRVGWGEAFRLSSL